MSKLIYLSDADNLITGLTLSSTGGGGTATGFPLSNLAVLPIAKVVRTVNATDWSVTFDLGSGTHSVDSFALLNHNARLAVSGTTDTAVRYRSSSTSPIPSATAWTNTYRNRYAAPRMASTTSRAVLPVNISPSPWSGLPSRSVSVIRTFIALFLLRLGCRRPPQKPEAGLAARPPWRWIPPRRLVAPRAPVSRAGRPSPPAVGPADVCARS